MDQVGRLRMFDGSTAKGTAATASMIPRAHDGGQFALYLGLVRQKEEALYLKHEAEMARDGEQAKVDRLQSRIDALEVQLAAATGTRAT